MHITIIGVSIHILWIYYEISRSHRQKFHLQSQLRTKQIRLFKLSLNSETIKYNSCIVDHEYNCKENRCYAIKVSDTVIATRLGINLSVGLAIDDSQIKCRWSKVQYAKWPMAFREMARYIKNEYAIFCRCSEAEQLDWQHVDGTTFHSCYSLATVSRGKHRFYVII